jgi:superfamily I DNA and RNA helicase
MALLITKIDLHNLQDELEQTVIVTRKPVTRRDLETLSPQLLRLTNDQEHNLEMVKLNDRCVIDGAAGTGKTVLAMELARQYCEAGKSVALLCSNPNLSSRFERWTNTLSNVNGGWVAAGTPATLPSKALRGDSILKNKHRQRLDNWSDLADSLKRGYLDDEWEPFIEETVKALKDLEPAGIFDYLIVDEAQNLCDEVFLTLMDALLKKGLAKGCWTMFGDFTNQNIVSPRFIRDGRDVLKGRNLDWANDRLKTNCRNTHEIAAAVAMFVDIESPPMSGVYGPLVQIEYFDSQEELEHLLNRLVTDLRSRDFSAQQIILLVSDRSDENNEFKFDTYGGWKLLNIREETLPDLKTKEGVLIHSDPASDDTLRYSNVYDFQGLESDLAILVIPLTEEQAEVGEVATLPNYEHLRRVLYTGMSRAKVMLIIVAHKSYEEHLELEPRFEKTYKDYIGSFSLL